MVSDVRESVTIASDSPWLAGHFPDDPILPGIAQLKMIADLIRSSSGEKLKIAGLSRVKFRKVVRPLDQLDMLVSCEEEGQRYRFTITCEHEDVCSGKMYFRKK